MCIVTGHNIDIAIKLIKRMKALFVPKLHVTFDSKAQLPYRPNSQVPYDKYLEVSITTLVITYYEKAPVFLQTPYILNV
jgi:hypothetical protein